MRVIGLALGAQPRLALAQLRGELVAEVVSLEDRTNLDLALLERGALEPLDRLVQRLDLPDPVARHQLLRLGERPIDDLALAARERDPGALGARTEPLAGELTPALTNSSLKSVIWLRTPRLASRRLRSRGLP